MARYFVMGNYTAKAFQGFIKDPSQDRSAAVKALTESAGGKLESFAITRGQFDFCAVTSGDMPFENFAGVKLAVEARFRPKSGRNARNCEKLLNLLNKVYFLSNNFTIRV